MHLGLCGMTSSVMSRGPIEYGHHCDVTMLLMLSVIVFRDIHAIFSRLRLHSTREPKFTMSTTNHRVYYNNLYIFEARQHGVTNMNTV